MIKLSIYLFFAITTVLFTIGIVGVILNRRNILMVLMSIELMLLAVNLNFAATSIYLDDLTGQIYIIFILTIAAVESAIGLSLIAIIYKLKNNIDVAPVKKITNKL